MADKIHLTDATRELVGDDVIKFLESQPYKPDVIFSRLDFESDDIFGWLADQGRVDNLIRLGGVEDMSFDERDRGHAIVKNALTRMMDGAVSIENNAMRADVSGIAKMIDGEYTRSITNNDIDFVTTLRSESSVEFFNAVTKIPEDQFSELAQNVNFKDLSTYALFHEVAHTDPAQDGMARSEKELDADLKANTMYKDALAQGVVNDPNVPKVFAQVRAISTVMGNGGSHYLYNGTINPDTNQNHVTHDGHSHEDATMIRDAIKSVHRDIAAPIINARHEFEAMALAGDYEHFATPEQIAEIERLDAMYDDAPLEEIEALMADITIPKEHQENYQTYLDIKIEFEGRDMAQDQPELMYEQVKLSLMRGDFDDQPAVKTLMENFVIGAEQLTPDHFGVEGTPYITHKQSIGEDVGLNSPSTTTHDHAHDGINPLAPAVKF